MPIVILVLSVVHQGPSVEQTEQIGGKMTVTDFVLNPRCSDWAKQEDGSYWRICVDDNGRQYCEVSKNGTVSRVKCSAS